PCPIYLSLFFLIMIRLPPRSTLFPTRRSSDLPWDRLDNNRPFVDGVGSKPLGANFYPADMTKEEFEKWESDAKKDLYTLDRSSRSEEHTSELQSRFDLVCRLLLEKKNNTAERN